MEQELIDLLKLFDNPSREDEDILRVSLNLYLKNIPRSSIRELARRIKGDTKKNISNNTLTRFLQDKGSRIRKSTSIIKRDPEILKLYVAFLYNVDEIKLANFTRQEQISASAFHQISSFHGTNLYGLYHPYAGYFSNVKASQLENEEVIFFNFKLVEDAAYLEVEQLTFKCFDDWKSWEDENQSIIESAEQELKRLRQEDKRYKAWSINDIAMPEIGTMPCQRFLGKAYLIQINKLEIKSGDAYKKYNFSQADNPLFNENSSQILSFHLLDNSSFFLNDIEGESIKHNIIYFQRVTDLSCKSLSNGFNIYEERRRKEASRKAFVSRRFLNRKIESKGLMQDSFNENNNPEVDIDRKIDALGMSISPRELGELAIRLAEILSDSGYEERPDIEGAIVQLIDAGAYINIRHEYTQETMLHMLASIYDIPEGKKLEDCPAIMALLHKGIDTLALDHCGALASSNAFYMENDDVALELTRYEDLQAKERGVPIPDQSNLIDNMPNLRQSEEYANFIKHNQPPPSAEI